MWQVTCVKVIKAALGVTLLGFVSAYAPTVVRASGLDEAPHVYDPGSSPFSIMSVIDRPSASNGSVQIATKTTDSAYQWYVGGEQGVSTVFTSDGSVATVVSSSVADTAKSAGRGAALTGPKPGAVATPLEPVASPAPRSADTPAASLSWQADGSTPAPPTPVGSRHPKFRKLIFAAAILPFAVLVMAAKHKRTASTGADKWSEGGVDARPRSFAGIVVGSTITRPKDSYSIPANHPWYTT